jgi:ferredoxin
MTAPDAFELDDVDGHASVVFDVIPTDQEALVREAAHCCPEQAITVED